LWRRRRQPRAILVRSEFREKSNPAWFGRRALIPSRRQKPRAAGKKAALVASYFSRMWA
jgi:hypothetical protein